MGVKVIVGGMASAWTVGACVKVAVDEGVFVSSVGVNVNVALGIVMDGELQAERSDENATKHIIKKNDLPILSYQRAAPKRLGFLV